MVKMDFVLIFSILLLVITGSISQTDLECLTEFRQSVTDTQGVLKSWDNGSCSSYGVQCLHQSDTVYSLSLSGAGLSGNFPKGLEKCQSLTGLDLSNNKFTGPIPPNICKMLPYLVTLDLSSNSFTGTIPEDLSQCQYINKLDLHHNQLTGSVPGQLGLLSRLTTLNLAENSLSGVIPSTLAKQPRSAFDNTDLCGAPLKSCGGSKLKTGLIAGLVVAGAVLLGAIAAVFLILKKRPTTKMKDDATWVSNIKSPRSITVSMFEQFLVKIRFSDLMAATDNFSKQNMISSGPSGVSYKATLRDGSVLAVKRLTASTRSEQQFRTEVETLGHVRHQNLVPLLGYCIAGSERLLIYKHMTNGSLYNWLYGVEGGERLDWPARLRIGLGAARALAYLHHSCNPRILHRNVSPHTILLDDDLEPRITDFGLIRLMSPKNDGVNQEVVADFGDPGHIAPEYARIPITTSKGDVYSFGVVLLELLTSQKPLDISVGEFKGSLVEWVGTLYSSGRSSEAVDKSLMGRGVDEEVLYVLKVACSCVLFLPKDRPSMYEVFQELKKIGEKYDFTDQDDEILIAGEDEAAAAAAIKRVNANSVEGG